MLMQTKTCQSYARPIENDSLKGTEADGMMNELYCLYCYKDGRFKHDCSMADMVELAVPAMSKNNPYPDENSVRRAMNDFFPTLKRWKKG